MSAEPEAAVDEDEAPQAYVRSCAGYVYFADQGIEICETCGGCTCCDHADVDHRNARHRCLFDRDGMKCLLVGSKIEHDCERDRLAPLGHSGSCGEGKGDRRD